MSEDLARFLADRYDEAEALAKAATEGPWAWEATGDQDSSWAVGQVQDEDGTPLTGQLEHGQGVIIDGVCEGIDGNLADAEHIAATGPAHRLADIKLKRAILAEHTHEAASTPAYRKGPESFGCATCDYIADEGIYGGGWCATARQLGTEFTSHPAYKPGWAPEG